MVSTRYTVAGAVSLVGGGLAILLQYLVTPLKGGSLNGTDLLDAAATHHAAMGWAVALDVPVLLAAPAILFIGGLARMRTSKLAAAATVLLFFPLLISLPPVFGFDGLAYFASAEPNRAAMVHLVDAWQNSAYFAVGLFPYVLCQVVGSVMMAIALRKAGTVPVWTAIAVGLWPLLSAAGIASGSTLVAGAGYVVLLVAWSACGRSLVRQRRTSSTRTALVPA